MNTFEDIVKIDYKLSTIALIHLYLLRKSMNNQLSLKHSVAVVLGNAFEWYDYFVYSFLGVYLAKLFFPASNELNSLLAVTATFGAAFLMRPLGGLILGMLADKYGRVRAMNWAMVFMMTALVILSCAPTYQQVGIIAPLLVLFARLLQGFSAGGECAVSPVILFESAPVNRRGLYCCLQPFSQMIAVQLSLVVGIALSRNLSLAEIEAWGWRIPFIIGLLIIPIGVYIRRCLKDPNTTASRASETLLTTVQNNRTNILIVIGLVSGGTVATYVLLSYMPTYVTTYLHLPLADAYCATLIGVVLMTVFIPVFGWLCDKKGRKNLLQISLLCCFLEIYPCYLWLNAAPSLQRLIIIQCLLCFTLSIYYGAIQVAITELFARNVRSTCLSLGVNTSVLLFGALAQFFVTLSIKYFANPLAVTIYPLLGIGIALIATMFYREHWEKETPLMPANLSI